MTAVASADGRPPLDGAGLLAALEAGAIRAAHPDPAAAGGWRVDHAVKAAILRCFADRTPAETAAGPCASATVPACRSTRSRSRTSASFRAGRACGRAPTWRPGSS